MGGKIVNKKQVMDLETGEILDVVSFIPDARDKDFVKVFKTCSKKVIQDLRDINGAVFLLFWIMDNLQMDSDKIYINPKLVAEELGKSVSSVKNYIRALVEKGYLFKVKGLRCWYRINTAYLYKGKVKKVFDDGPDF